MSRVLPPSRLQARRRKRRVLFVLGSFLFLLVLAAILVAFAHAPFLRIRTTEVSGTETIAPSELQQFAAQELSGSYWWLFPKDNILLYPRAHLTADLLAAFAPLRAVSITANSFSAITIAVSERAPVALWCGLSPATSSPCLLLDESGVAYAEAATSSTYTPYYGTLPSSGQTLPAQFLLPGQFQSLEPLVGTLGAEAESIGSGNLQNVVIDSQGNVTLQFQSGFQLLFLLSTNPGVVAENFSLAISSQAFAGRSAADFQYLDMRFGEKLYYLLKSTTP